MSARLNKFTRAEQAEATRRHAAVAPPAAPDAPPAAEVGPLVWLPDDGGLPVPICGIASPEAMRATMAGLSFAPEVIEALFAHDPVPDAEGSGKYVLYARDGGGF